MLAGATRLAKRPAGGLLSWSHERLKGRGTHRPVVFGAAAPRALVPLRCVAAIGERLTDRSHSEACTALVLVARTSWPSRSAPAGWRWTARGTRVRYAGRAAAASSCRSRLWRTRVGGSGTRMAAPERVPQACGPPSGHRTFVGPPSQGRHCRRSRGIPRARFDRYSLRGRLSLGDHAACQGYRNNLRLPPRDVAKVCGITALVSTSRSRGRSFQTHSLARIVPSCSTATLAQNQRKPATAG